MFCFSIDNETALRLLEERHAEELFALTDQNRAYLREWLPWVDGVQSAEHTKQFIKSASEQFAQNQGLGIWHKGKLAGVIGFHKIDWANRKTSIGYWLGAEFQGRGLMTKSCRALVDYALRELKLNRVEIRLVTDQKRWFLLDWDDLALGDPALDYAMLLRNALSQNKRLPWQDFLGARDIYFAQRMELYLRAGLLDQVIDVLADYVECAVAPEHRERVQEQKRREHVEALSRYRKIYGAEKQLRT